VSLGLGAFFLSYYLAAGIGVNLAYHRLLAHRSLRLPVFLERAFVTLGLPAGTPVQWVGTHRVHHKVADTDEDPHSPLFGGFLHAHVGWYLETDNRLACIAYCFAGPFRLLFDAWHRPRTNQRYISSAKDISNDSYYALLSRPHVYGALMLLHFLVPVSIVVLLSGPPGFLYFWGFLIFIYNTADGVDSVAHLWGKKNPGTNTNARDVPLLGILSLGDGWHSSHHQFPYSAQHGLKKGQIDVVWQIIKVLRKLGIASEIRLPVVEMEPEQEKF